MAIKKMNIPDKVQIRLTSSVESIRASLEPYVPWIEQTLGMPLSETLTLEVDCNPGDAVAEELLQGLPVVSATQARNRSWRKLIEHWALPSGASPRIAASLQRERRPKTAPVPVWELDWQDCPVALKLRGLARHVVSVKVPLVFPPSDLPLLPLSSAQHWFIAHREDAALFRRRLLKTGGTNQLRSLTPAANLTNAGGSRELPAATGRAYSPQLSSGMSPLSPRRLAKTDGTNPVRSPGIVAGVMTSTATRAALSQSS